MRVKHFLFVILILAIWSCTNRDKGPQKAPSFSKYIEFNHLYITIDDRSYDFLLDSLGILDKFCLSQENNVNVGEESWRGIYLYGKNNYVEFFKEGSFEGGKFGDLGLGFIANKLGTLDSLYDFWSAKFDSVHFGHRDKLNPDGNYQSWFNYVDIPDEDSLHVQPWLMEHTKDHMLDCGFTENQLENEIAYWDYLRNWISSSYKIPVDSIKYEKPFNRITALYLTLSQEELTRLKLYLYDFGFKETENTFSKDDFAIKYKLSESNHFILNQIDFSLLDSVPEQKQTYRSLAFQMDGFKASLKFNY